MKRKTMCVLLTVFLMSFSFVPASAAEQPQVIRVPFTELEGLMELEPDGSRHGLVIDYLNEIAKYTGWKYEYIDTDGENGTKDFIEGEYDLMGGMYYSPVMESYCSYPDYSMGNSKAVLMARQDDDRINSTNVRTLNGKTIGVYERAEENIRRLNAFISMNNLDCTLKYYNYEQLSTEGNLYSYLENGEVDLLLGNSMERNNGFRVAFSYDSQPYYIVAQPGAQEITDELNMALEKIMDSNPAFAEERYLANFSGVAAVDIHLNQDEKAYIKQHNVVTVAIPRELHPLCCRKGVCEHNGLAVDILTEISAFTGLTFSYQYTDSYIDSMHLVQQGKADIMGCFLGSESEAIEKNLVLTASFSSINNIIVRNKRVNLLEDELVAAEIDGRTSPADAPVSEILVYPNAVDAISAVNRGEADFAYGMAPYLESLLENKYFPNVITTTALDDHTNISFAMAQPASHQLLTILNKALNNIPSAEKSELLDQNIFFSRTGALSATELVYANPIVFVGILSAFFILLCIAVVWITHAKMRAAAIQNNLEKAKAESQAKGDFLSRMSHELRTPMNAVVGLADLISMSEGLPENVRGNLEKLKASAYYLLDLINDILDTSRLENGMLTIAEEPFSLESMLDKLSEMMEADAKKRGLTYLLEKEIEHCNVSGDVIRLRQVLTNLLANAFKFTPRGGRVTLQVTESAANEHSATYIFSVIDTGVGILKEEQAHIFKSFEQVGTNYSKSQGTGLGLTISHAIVEKMGGELCVESELEQGSIFFFTITLPLSSPIEDDLLSQESSVIEKDLTGISIMLAEDNELNAEIATELLNMQGVLVTRAKNGRQALDLFTQNAPGHFQVILMDIQMPEMSGLDAARAIRELERPDAKTIPIIAMTANAFREDVDAAMASGMNEFVSKPLDVARLFHLLRRFLADEVIEE